VERPSLQRRRWQHLYRFDHTRECDDTESPGLRARWPNLQDAEVDAQELVRASVFQSHDGSPNELSHRTLNFAPLSRESDAEQEAMNQISGLKEGSCCEI
jgi:hypothetical protein